MKVLILGAKGLLGQDLVKVFNNHEVFAWDKEELNILDKIAVKEKITELHPAVVINSAAYTAVDASESNKDLAVDVNANGARNVAFAAKEIGAKVVYYSSDYVFSGENKNGYNEASAIAPINAYGESKAMGEKFVMEANSQFYIVRTSWMFGKNGSNFVYAMLKLSNEFPKLTVVDDQFGNPTYSADLAERTKYILENNLPFGIYHATNDTKDLGISWYDFAKRIFEIKKINIDLQPIPTDQFPRPAKRPSYSVLLNTKLPKMRSWDEALLEFLSSNEFKF